MTHNTDDLRTVRRRDTEPTVETAVEARQGVTGHNVRYVLGIGLTSAIVALGLLWYFFFF